MYLYDKSWLCAIGFALVYYVAINARENLISGMEMFQSNIYYYVSITGVLCISGKDVPRNTWKRRTKTYQELKLENLSKCKRFLCMLKILVHAQHSCACTTLLCMHWRGQGPRPGPNKKAAAPGRTCGCFFCITRILCMHKNLILL